MHIFPGRSCVLTVYTVFSHTLLCPAQSPSSLSPPAMIELSFACLTAEWMPVTLCEGTWLPARLEVPSIVFSLLPRVLQHMPLTPRERERKKKGRAHLPTSPPNLPHCRSSVMRIGTSELQMEREQDTTEEGQQPWE